MQDLVVEVNPRKRLSELFLPVFVGPHAIYIPRVLAIGTSVPEKNRKFKKWIYIGTHVTSAPGVS